MEALVVPFTAATVFTLGGYGIMQAKRHADAIGIALGLAVLTCALLALTLLLNEAAAGACIAASDLCYAPFAGPGFDTAMVF